MSRTLNDEFTLEALAHVETRRPEIPIFHIFASVGEMVNTGLQDTETSSAQSKPRTALIEWLNNNRIKRRRTWMYLVEYFKEIKAVDEATKIEQLFVSTYITM